MNFFWLRWHGVGASNAPCIFKNSAATILNSNDLFFLFQVRPAKTQFPSFLEGNHDVLKICELISFYSSL